MNLTVFAGILLAVTMVTAQFEIADLVEKKMNKRMKQQQPLAVERKVPTTGGNLPPQPLAVERKVPTTGGKTMQAAGEADEPEVEKKMNKRMKLEAVIMKSRMEVRSALQK